MVSQNVLNLVDTAMVGFLGNAALAAVGIGGFALFMFQALILGISIGVQAMAARRKGEGNLQQTALPLNAGLLLVVLIAPVWSLLLFFLVPELYPFLNSDPDVIVQGVPYLQARVLAIVFIGMNFAFRGYWNGVDLSRLYMSTLVIMHASNIVLNYILIFGKFGAPALGATGAGIASALSTIIGSSIYILLGFRFARENGFLHGLPSREQVVSLVRLSLPNGIQQLFFAAGLTALFWIIGQVGTAELAAANVMVNVMLVALLPSLGLGLASATLVGQALGRGDAADAAQWAWDVVKIGVVAMLLLGTPMWLVPDLILAGFLHDPATIEIARLPMRIMGITMLFEALGMVLMNSLLGAGDTRRVMVVTIALQWLLFLPAAYLVGPVLGYGLLGIWILQGLYRVTQAGVFSTLWLRGQWKGISV